MQEYQMFNEAMAHILGLTHRLVKAIKAYENVPGISLQFQITEGADGKMFHDVKMIKLIDTPAVFNLDEELKKLFLANGRTFKVEEKNHGKA